MSKPSQSQNRLYDDSDYAPLVICLIVGFAVVLCFFLLWWAQRNAKKRNDQVHAASADITDEKIRHGIVTKEWTEHDIESEDVSSCALCNQSFKIGEEVCSSYNEQCQHLYHKACIDNWLHLQNTCPTCNKAFMMENVEDV